MSNQPQEHDIVCAEDDYTNSEEPDCDLYINDFFPSYESRYYVIKRAKTPEAHFQKFYSKEMKKRLWTFLMVAISK